MSRLISWLFFGYHYLFSPILSQIVGQKKMCRFTPSCTVYGAIQIKKHGIIKGGTLFLRQLSSCHPW